MDIREESTRAFMEAYKDEYDEELSFEEAKAMLFRLVYLYVQLSRPIPEKKN